MDYKDFLKTKADLFLPTGKEPSVIHPALYDFQSHVARWAIRKGRAAIWADVGLGKTIMQGEIARQINERTLFVAPLTVSHQTARALKDTLDMEVHYARSSATASAHQFVITNYEMLDHFDPDEFPVVILDESSILKQFRGVTKQKLVSMFENTPYRYALTATPAPNDILELGNHAQFLGVMTSAEMTARYFIHESGKQGTSNTYRLKRHAKRAFYEWLSTWAIAFEKPSDLGFDDTGYILPELTREVIEVDADYTPEGMLPGFAAGSISATDAKGVRRQTIESRARVVAEMVNASAEQWIIWTELNDEGDALTALIPDAINIHGSMETEDKIKGLLDFAALHHRVLITKPSIAGMGLNLQNCANMIFFGIDYSWEKHYQAIGRIHRYGQLADVVRLFIVISRQERPILDIVEKKGIEAKRMTQELIEAASEFTEKKYSQALTHVEYHEETMMGKGWKLMLGDSCQRMSEIPDNSVGLSVYSPPFANIYIYSATDRDLGNSRDMAEFMAHYRYIIAENLRITMPGRVACVHIQDRKMYENRDGFRGIQPMSDEIVQAYIDAGWIYRARITIDKNPQLVATRNKDTDLLFVTGKRDSTDLAPMNADYLLVFKKEGDNDHPVKPYETGEMSEEDWILWARAVWYGIKETNVLNTLVAKSNQDERHICPLQLDLIERCIRLWSNRGDTIFSPFAGIGSEVYEAVRLGREGLGIELKPEYYKVAIRNLRRAEIMATQGRLL